MAAGSCREGRADADRRGQLRLLLQQHRQCVAKIAPEQLNGVDAMADELRDKAQTQSVEAMVQECKALRSIAEMMWTDACR